jgi:hypothetical protein
MQCTHLRVLRVLRPLKENMVRPRRTDWQPKFLQALPPVRLHHSRLRSNRGRDKGDRVNSPDRCEPHPHRGTSSASGSTVGRVTTRGTKWWAAARRRSNRIKQENEVVPNPSQLPTAIEGAELEPLADTVTLVYEHTKGGPARQVSEADAIDAKAFQAFAAASVILGFGTFAASHFHAVSASAYGAAIAAYVIAGRCAFVVVRARVYQVVDGADRWWPSHRLAYPDYVMEQMLDDLAAATKYNRVVLNAKGKPLNTLLIAIAAEAILVAVAVIAALA